MGQSSAGTEVPCQPVHERHFCENCSEEYVKAVTGTVRLILIIVSLAPVVLTPFHLVPAMGIIVSAWLRALGTAQYLHKPV